MKTNQMNEWAQYLKKFNGGASRSDLMASARKMVDAENRKTALMNLGVLTPQDRREIKARWDSINNVTQSEINAHCQFAGLPTL